MSGTNKIIVGQITIKNKPNSVLVSCLENANEEVIKETPKK